LKILKSDDSCSLIATAPSSDVPKAPLIGADGVVDP
jgi:hypothetical protein